MSALIGSAAPVAVSSPVDRLRQAARQLEGVFVTQLFHAMRATVPEGGALDGGSGEAMFRDMLDEHMADQAPARWHDGLTTALVAQLRAQMHEGASAAAPTGADSNQ